MKNGLFTVEWSDEDEVFIAKHSDFKSLATHGDTPHEALKELEPLVVEARNAQDEWDDATDSD